MKIKEKNLTLLPLGELRHHTKEEMPLFKEGKSQAYKEVLKIIDDYNLSVLSNKNKKANEETQVIVICIKTELKQQILNLIMEEN